MFKFPHAALPLLMAFLLASTSVHAEEGAEEKKDPEHETDVVQVFELDAPRDAVWKAFTTEEQAQKWMAPLMKIDMRTGGSMKATYQPAQGLDGPGVITHRILALHAPHFAVMRTEVKKGHPFYGIVDQLVGTWRFDELPGGRTRLSLGMHGWPDTAQARQVQGYFKQMNPRVFQQLAKLFPKREAGPEVEARLSKLVGEWTATLDQGQQQLLIHKSIRKGPGGKGFICITSFGPEGARRMHKHEHVWSEADGRVRFSAIDDGGGYVAGRIFLRGDDALIWDFEDKGRLMRLDMNVPKDGQHRFAVQMREDDGTTKELFHVDYKRKE